MCDSVVGGERVAAIYGYYLWGWVLLLFTRAAHVLDLVWFRMPGTLEGPSNFVPGRPVEVCTLDQATPHQPLIWKEVQKGDSHVCKQHVFSLMLHNDDLFLFTDKQQ